MSDLRRGDAVNPNDSQGLFTSQNRESSTRRAARPAIKKEPLDEDSPEVTLAGLDEADDDFDGETEGLLADHEGIEYYCDAGFKIKQVPTPTIVQRTLGDLYNLSHTKYLKLDPEYQREVVWDEVRASALIASVLQGYFIPPIIFNVIPASEPLNDGSGKKRERYVRICVDGKQRLTSVQKFMDGLIGVQDSCAPPKKWFYRHPIVNGLEKVSNHNILPDSTKEFFRGQMFCCYEYLDMPESVEENMFQLVQRGMPLTPAERMRALSTKWATFAKQYEVDYPMVVNLSKQARASGFRSVVTIFCQILEVMYPSGNKRTNSEGVGPNPTLQASPQLLTKLLLDDKSLNEAVKAKLKQVFDRYQELVDLSTQKSVTAKLGFKVIRNSAFDPAPDFLMERNVGHVKTFSPLELVATAILLLVHGDSRTLAMLLGDIKEMRFFLRQRHRDLRLNHQCWATAWTFIDTELIKLRGGKGAVRRRGVAASVDYETIEDNQPEQSTAASTPMTARQHALTIKSQVNSTDHVRSRQSRSSRSNSVSTVNGHGGGHQAVASISGTTLLKVRDRRGSSAVNGPGATDGPMLVPSQSRKRIGDLDLGEAVIKKPKHAK